MNNGISRRVSIRGPRILTNWGRLPRVIGGLKRVRIRNVSIGSSYSRRSVGGGGIFEIPG